MIISRTPFRISFFGGGTDYPRWFNENGGAVLATTIDKYCYLTCRLLPPFFEHKTRIAYSHVELVRSHDEIKHPAVWAALKYLKIEEGLEIHHDGDLPARTGLGSSSAFTVGILHALHGLQRSMPTKRQLAYEAIHLERDLLKETGGIQDQVVTAFGGFNKIEFSAENEFSIHPVIMDRNRLLELQDHLMLFFTGFARSSSEISKEQFENIPKKKSELARLFEIVEEAIALLSGNCDMTEFGTLLHESWKVKRTLSLKISSSEVYDAYEAATETGSFGGKILGAGGGGFLLLFARPEDQPKIRERLKTYLPVPFRFENNGSQIIFFEPDLKAPEDHLPKVSEKLFESSS